MKISLSHKLLTVSAIVIAANGLLGYAVYKIDQVVLDSEQWVQHTDEVINQSAKIHAISKDMETASAGFVFTGDKSFLDPLYTAQKTVFASLLQLRKLTADNPAQQKRVDSLNIYIKNYLSFSLQTVEKRKRQANGPTIFNSVRQGKVYTARILQITRAIQQEESDLLIKRRKTNTNSVTVFHIITFVILILVAGLTILLILFIGKYIYEVKEKEKKSAELVMANKKLFFQNEEKEKRATELLIANEELFFQNEEKEKRAAELIVANKELVFQNEEKEKRAAELIIANKELVFQNEEKEKRAAELIIANNELVFQNIEKEKRAAELIIANWEVRRAENELRKLNEDIRKLNEELERKVMERTAELESANQELESFSYSVSHDLRAPLRAVNGFAILLSEHFNELFDNEGKRLLNIIQENATRMGVLIDDLLALSRMGRKEISKSVIDMTALAKNALSEFNISRQFKAQVTINDLHQVLADNSLMTQVWVNLLSNAIKYSSHKRNAVITISSEEKNGELIYSVADNGVGFDMHYAHKLFGVFQRLHNAGDFEGTGVGLALVYRIITKHGGRIWAKAQVGKGATFYFSLPKKIN